MLLDNYREVLCIEFMYLRCKTFASWQLQGGVMYRVYVPEVYNMCFLKITGRCYVLSLNI